MAFYQQAEADRSYKEVVAECWKALAQTQEVPSCPPVTQCGCHHYAEGQWADIPGANAVMSNLGETCTIVVPVLLNVK